MKKTIFRRFQAIRYCICTPVVLFIGLITAPLNLIFGWKGYYLLYIANQESCSFSQAKEILSKSNKYKIVSKSLFINGVPLYHNNNFNNDIKRSRDFDERFSPAYKNLPSNIHHNRYMDDMFS